MRGDQHDLVNRAPRRCHGQHRGVRARLNWRGRVICSPSGASAGASLRNCVSFIQAARAGSAWRRRVRMPRAGRGERRSGRTGPGTGSGGRGARQMPRNQASSPRAQAHLLQRIGSGAARPGTARTRAITSEFLTAKCIDDGARQRPARFVRSCRTLGFALLASARNSEHSSTVVCLHPDFFCRDRGARPTSRSSLMFGGICMGARAA